MNGGCAPCFVRSFAWSLPARFYGRSNRLALIEPFNLAIFIGSVHSSEKFDETARDVINAERGGFPIY